MSTPYIIFNQKNTLGVRNQIICGLIDASINNWVCKLEEETRSDLELLLIAQRASRLEEIYNQILKKYLQFLKFLFAKRNKFPKMWNYFRKKHDYIQYANDERILGEYAKLDDEDLQYLSTFPENNKFSSIIKEIISLSLEAKVYAGKTAFKSIKNCHRLLSSWTFHKAQVVRHFFHKHYNLALSKECLKKLSNQPGDAYLVNVRRGAELMSLMLKEFSEKEELVSKIIKDAEKDPTLPSDIVRVIKLSNRKTSPGSAHLPYLSDAFLSQHLFVPNATNKKMGASRILFSPEPPKDTPVTATPPSLIATPTLEPTVFPEPVAASAKKVHEDSALHSLVVSPSEVTNTEILFQNLFNEVSGNHNAVLMLQKLEERFKAHQQLLQNPSNLNFVPTVIHNNFINNNISVVPNQGGAATPQPKAQPPQFHTPPASAAGSPRIRQMEPTPKTKRIKELEDLLLETESEKKELEQRKKDVEQEKKILEEDLQILIEREDELNKAVAQHKGNEAEARLDVLNLIDAKQKIAICKQYLEEENNTLRGKLLKKKEMVGKAIEELEELSLDDNIEPSTRLKIQHIYGNNLVLSPQ
jgi:hypothetical protein